MCCSAYHWQSFLIFSIWNIYFPFSSFLLLLSHPPLFVLSFFYPVFNQGIKTGISVMGKKFITGFTHNIIVEADGDVHGRFSSVQSLSHVRLFATPWIAARQASLSINNSWSSLRLNIHRVGDAFQPSHPLSSPFPPAPNPSHHQSLFQWVNSSHEVAKVLEFQL